MSTGGDEPAAPCMKDLAPRRPNVWSSIRRSRSVTCSSSSNGFQRSGALALRRSGSTWDTFPTSFSSTSLVRARQVGLSPFRLPFKPSAAPHRWRYAARAGNRSGDRRATTSAASAYADAHLRRLERRHGHGLPDLRQQPQQPALLGGGEAADP